MVNESLLLEATPDTACAGHALIDVTVQRITPEADGVISIAMKAAGGGSLPPWTPGAHIGVQLPQGLERQYSLCGEPQDRQQWQIAVLREPASRGGSAWLHEHLSPGDRLRVKPPANQFRLVEAKAYHFIAGGIGITPLLPMMRALQRTGANWRLLYGGRRLDSMAFVEPLRRFGDRVRIAPEDTHGLLDLADWLGQPRDHEAVYCCGPERLLAAVEARCQAWPEGALHVERFRPRPGALEGAANANAGSFEVVLARSQLTCTVQPGQTIVAALEDIGVYVPQSCGEGTCGTCVTRVLEGSPDHRDSFLLGKKREANDAICVCCSRSLSPRLVLDL